MRPETPDVDPAARLARIRASQDGVVQPDGAVLFLLAEIDRLTADLAAERERNAPLRARIKSLADHHDADTAGLRKQVARFKALAKHGQSTTMMNYEKWRSAEQRADAACEELGHTRQLATQALRERDRLSACDSISHAELARFVQEARAQRERADALEVALAEVRAGFIKHRTATHKVQPTYCETCRESDALLVADPVARGAAILAAGKGLAEGARMQAAVWGNLVDGNSLRDAVEAWNRATRRPAGEGGDG